MTDRLPPRRPELRFACAACARDLTLLVAAGAARCSACDEPTASARVERPAAAAPGWLSRGRTASLALAPALAVATAHPIVLALGLPHAAMLELFLALALTPACLAAAYRVELAHGPGERPSFYATALGLFLIMLNGFIILLGAAALTL